jgi:peptidyl-prolyl cis-trans isomerase SurA
MPPFRPVSNRALICIAALLVAGCRPASTPAPAAATASADAWATVDGREITRQAVEKAYQRMRDPAQPLSEEEALTAKLSVLNDMIVEDILLAKARELKVEVPASELDAAYGEAKKNISDEAFQEEIKKRGLTADEMREGLRREMLTQKVIEREVGSKVSVTDQEITDFFNANRAQFNLAEEAYHLAQIVITPARDPQIANRTGDDATSPQAAATKAKMLMERLKSGTSFGDLAMDYSEDPETAPRGGDLGLVPISRLKQTPQPLRDAVLNKKPGAVNAVPAGGGYTLVLVVAHEMPGQRDLTTPGLRDRITETIRARKEQLLRAAYLTAARTDADIVNYLARQIVESQGKQPATPKSLIPNP